jgi:CBF1 interacting corepressor
VTHEQMVERFAVLKNAPMEGGYAKGMVVKHKPFCEQLRNVHCIRCGQWGHMSGERECPLRDYNPNDYERQQREDPMRRMLDGPSAGAGGAYAGPGRNSSSSANGGAGISRQRCTFVDEAGDSDPEAEFLSTLTRREKKLLLRKLQVSFGIYWIEVVGVGKCIPMPCLLSHMRSFIIYCGVTQQALETGQPATKQGRAPHSEDSSESSSSSSSSDSESDSSSDSDSSRSGARKHKRRRERSKGEKKRKHAHSKKEERKKESKREHRKEGKQSHKEQRRS